MGQPQTDDPKQPFSDKQKAESASAVNRQGKEPEQQPEDALRESATKQLGLYWF